MSTAIATNQATAIEAVLIGGDLARLTPEQRVAYYHQVCESVGLNPLTKPFEYITLNGKLVLYALKNCTEQLRKIHTVSIKIVSREMVDDVYVVTSQATLPSGRCDESIGAVPLGMLKGEPRANAIMKAETKAKRRVTLSIVGLGMLDETEVETIPGAKVAAEMPAIVDAKPSNGQPLTPPPAPAVDVETTPPTDGPKMSDPTQHKEIARLFESRTAKTAWIERSAWLSNFFARPLTKTIKKWGELTAEEAARAIQALRLDVLLDDKYGGAEPGKREWLAGFFPRLTDPTLSDLTDSDIALAIAKLSPKPGAKGKTPAPKRLTTVDDEGNEIDTATGEVIA